MRSGVTMTSTLLAKDTSHRTVFPVFTAGGGIGLDEMEGAGNFVMVADPATFRVLPWANDTGWMLCDIYFPNGKPVPFSTRALIATRSASSRSSGFDFFAGLEVEFHLFKLADPKLAPDSLTWPPEAPAVEHTTHGFQYLTEARFDQVDPILEMLRKTVQALGCRCARSKWNSARASTSSPSRPQRASPPPTPWCCSAAPMKQVARRHGHLASFMCRPRCPTCSPAAGICTSRCSTARSGKNLFVVERQGEPLSPLGRHYLAGLLAHARAAAAFTTPTINGYKRYHGVNSMAPIQAIWAQDNRGVMIRVLGEPGDASTHLENRVGEPPANPYLYMASQIHAGLDGIARKLDPGPSADAPYEVKAEPLPKSLAEALTALSDSACFRAGFGGAFVDYLLRIKQAEIARCDAETGGQSGNAAEVTAWEHNEYFDLA